MPRKKPGAVVSENLKTRKEIQREVQKGIAQEAIKDADAEMVPSKRGRFGKYELATKEEDAQDADEANLDKPIEPVLKKKKLKAPETVSKQQVVREEEKVTEEVLKRKAEAKTQDNETAESDETVGQVSKVPKKGSEAQVAPRSESELVVDHAMGLRVNGLRFGQLWEILGKRKLSKAKFDEAL